MLSVYNVNALGALRVAQSVLPLLRAGEIKRIINISSEAGSMAARVRRGQRTRYAYCASKAALNIQSILLQNHVAEWGIRVHLIEPGWLRTFLASKEKCTIAPTEPEESAERLVAFVQRDPRLITCSTTCSRTGHSIGSSARITGSPGRFPSHARCALSYRRRTPPKPGNDSLARPTP